MNQVFAQQVSRMCSLTDDCVTSNTTGTYVVLGIEPLRLPPGIAELFIEQVKACRLNPKAATRDGRRWLFPGQNYGRHITEDTIYRRLTQLEIRARPARNAALIYLAADTPAPILSRLLNINPQIAAKWSELAGNAYHGYMRNRNLDKTRASSSPMRRTQDNGRKPIANRRTKSLTN